MAYLKPPLLVRAVFNKLALRFGMSGTHALSVPGRRSGQAETVPVIPVDHEGARYVVSTRGESDWVRNVRAAGVVELGRPGKGERYNAIEVPVEERAPIIELYRAKAGRTVEAYWKKLPEPADHPTFRLEPSSPPTG